MSQHQAFLDRMTTRLADLEQQIAGLDRTGTHAADARELDAMLASSREQLQTMRRAGAELSEDQTRSYAQSFERLNAAVGKARGQAPRGPEAA